MAEEEPHLEEVADLLSIQASFVKDARNQVTKKKTVQSDAIIARRSIIIDDCLKLQWNNTQCVSKQENSDGYITLHLSILN